MKSWFSYSRFDVVCFSESDTNINEYVINTKMVRIKVIGKFFVLFL
jgi:hypothetical protein